jgi:methylenetetrahydrofolate dehydrogenase (NADP+)/methenyltetrahydrofolate cyclohydrolase
MPEIIDGNGISKEIIQELKEEVATFSNRKPKVVFIRVGEDPASVSYVSKKQKVAAEIGIVSELKVLEESISQDALLQIIKSCNQDPSVDGILIQAPLPKHIDETTVFNTVEPGKDVDGFNVVNVGKLCQEDETGFVACTPAGIVELLERKNIDPQGKHVVVVGRSLIVGKPAGLLMLKKSPLGNATVTYCHSRTKDIASITKQADILIAAIGKPHFITSEMVKEGAVIIDVGINRIEDSSKKSGFRLVGDVDYSAVESKTSAITPVPGGVGPMTVALLMKNTVKAFKLKAGN